MKILTLWRDLLDDSNSVYIGSFILRSIRTVKVQISVKFLCYPLVVGKPLIIIKGRGLMNNVGFPSNIISTVPWVESASRLGTLIRRIRSVTRSVMTSKAYVLSFADHKVALQFTQTCAPRQSFVALRYLCVRLECPWRR